MSDTIQEAVATWKDRRLRSSDLPFEVACKSIGTARQMFTAKRVSRVEWVLCDSTTNAPAVFSYAAIFASSDPMDTGNLVPTEKSVESGVEPQRPCEFASWRCNYSYGFDTTVDVGLFEAQSAIDKYMESVSGFNSSGQKRRSWQSGSPGTVMQRFWMRTPMFLRVDENRPKPPPPAHLHDWVKDADRRSRLYRANPARPGVFAIDGGVLKNISDCKPAQLVRGDAVAITFTISYIVGKSDWYPNFVLIDIVRVATEKGVAPDEDDKFGTDQLGDITRQALQDGEVLIGDNSSGVQNVSSSSGRKKSGKGKRRERSADWEDLYNDAALDRNASEEGASPLGSTGHERTTTGTYLDGDAANAESRGSSGDGGDVLNGDVIAEGVISTSSSDSTVSSTTESSVAWSEYGYMGTAEEQHDVGAGGDTNGDVFGKDKADTVGATRKRARAKK